MKTVPCFIPVEQPGNFDKRLLPARTFERSNHFSQTEYQLIMLDMRRIVKTKEAFQMLLWGGSRGIFTKKFTPILTF
jgi:hypothetical protein